MNIFFGLESLPKYSLLKLPRVFAQWIFFSLETLPKKITVQKHVAIWTVNIFVNVSELKNIHFCVSHFFTFSFFHPDNTPVNIFSLSKANIFSFFHPTCFHFFTPHFCFTFSFFHQPTARRAAADNRVAGPPGSRIDSPWNMIFTYGFSPQHRVSHPIAQGAW